MVIPHLVELKSLFNLLIDYSRWLGGFKPGHAALVTAWTLANRCDDGASARLSVRGRGSVSGLNSLLIRRHARSTSRAMINGSTDIAGPSCRGTLAPGLATITVDQVSLLCGLVRWSLLYKAKGQYYLKSEQLLYFGSFQSLQRRAVPWIWATII